MQRIGRWTRLKAGAEDEYLRWHRQVWPELLALIGAAGIRNYTIYRRDQDLFSYLETEDWESAMAFLSRQEVADRWQELMAPFMDADDPIAPWQVLEAIFHLE